MTRAEFTALALAAQADPKPLIERLCWITTKHLEGQAPVAQLVFNRAQRKVHDAILGQRHAGLPPRIIVCKARQPGICLDPNTLVLTADLRWVAIDQLHPGDEVVAVDEKKQHGRGRGRKMRTAMVVAKGDVVEPAFRLTMDDGRELIATAPHRFLSHRRGGTDTCWRRVDETRPGDEIRYVTAPWAAMEVEDGWFGGMMDGEGTCRPKTRAGVEVTVCQVGGPVWDRVVRYAHGRGYAYRIEVDRRLPGPSKLGKKAVYRVVFSRINEVFRLMGQARPTRWESLRWWEGKDLPGKKSGIGWAKVMSVEPLGTRRMVDLETTTGTYLAEGFVSHNSTQACGYSMATALVYPYAHSLIVTHLEKASISLFKKITFMREHLPADFRPNLSSSRREELILDSMPCSDGSVQLRTGITVGTASGGELWRGLTIQMAHLSEFASFPRPEETLLGVLQCVPPTPQSLVMIESTAQGMGNAFHEEWKRASSGESDFVPIFIGWWEVDEYKMPTPKDFELLPDELEMKRAFGLTNEQVQWRRYTVRTQCHGSVDQFNQEYPSDPSVAFLVSGRPAFSHDVLRLMALGAEQRKNEVEQGEISAEGQFFPLRQGRLKIFRRPESGHEYTMGVDPASGIPDGDYSAIQIFDRERSEQVAVWHGKMKPIPLAHIAAALGRWYHEAILAPEVTGGHGFSVVEELKSTQYPRIYVWQRVDRVRHSVSNFYGWETSFRSRPLLIDSTAYAIAERAVGIRDPATIRELMEFQYQDGRKAEGLHFDDLAMAWMIAYRVHLEMPLAKTGIPPRVHYADDGRQEPPQDLLQGISRDAWEAVDKDIARMKTQEAASDAMIDMPDPGDDDPALDFIPDLPW